MITLKRKNRCNGATIALHDNRSISYGASWIPDTWELECYSHGFVQSFDTKRLALSAIAHSDEWCPGCIEGWKVDNEDPPALPARQRDGEGGGM